MDQPAETQFLLSLPCYPFCSLFEKRMREGSEVLLPHLGR